VLTEQATRAHAGKVAPGVAYGLPCLAELFRFLTSLIDPTDSDNTDAMIRCACSLAFRHGVGSRITTVIQAVGNIT
jgi:hypothetical protein